MLNSGAKFCALLGKKKKYSNSCVVLAFSSHPIFLLVAG
jgi:hypothetical protein